MSTHQLQVIHLHCVRQQRLLFAPISFELHSGEMLLIEGPNGSGKSSLLRLLTGLSTPQEGCILWQSKNIQSIRDEYNENIHYIGHTNGIKLGLTVTENLQLAGHLALSTMESVEDVLEQWQLSIYQHSQTNYLSAGQKRRVALAKLILFKKPLWILDEPLTSLDAHSQPLFLHALENHLHQGGMAMISSHHPILINSAVKNLRLEAC